MKCAGAAAIAAIFFVGSPGCAQNAPAGRAQAAPKQEAWAQELNKNPELLAEFGRLMDNLQHNIQFPAARGESRLLPLLPQSTMSFAAFPNYGDVVNQALKVFRQELKESSALRDWWTHGEMATAGPKVEESLEQLYQLQQYLGEEIVVSGAMDGKEPRLLMIAEVRKPGLKKFLQQMVEKHAEKAKPGMRVLDLEELAKVKDKESGPAAQELVALVRPDFVVAALDLGTLRGFNARLDRSSHEFASTAFGQRVAQEYQGGVTVLGAADLHTILNQLPPEAKQSATFQQSGFADMKYAVWEHKSVAGQDVSQSELSFSAPRHGAAAWLAKSGPLSSLDFVSPSAILAGTVVLSNPAQILDDAKELASLSNSNAFAALPIFEQGLKLSLKDDLLSLLGGEITVELDNLTPPQPAWKTILKVKDANHLQQTLSTLLAATHMAAESFAEEGVTYHTLRIPSGNSTTEIGYAFAGGHLIIGSSRSGVAEAVQLHRSGGSLGKSKKFLASLPPGHGLNASALLYQDPIAMTALRLGQFAPDLAGALAQYSREATPAVVWVYGEETAIREASTNAAYDAAAVLVVAAIAIPNLLRSRMAANEASAVGSVRTVNTAQVTYAATYPKRGYAPNLVTLGPDPRGPNAQSPDHAGFLDGTLANERCTGDAWCTKSGFQFRVKAICKLQQCQEYVVIATPVSDNTGARSFCATSDGVVRFKVGAPSAVPVSVTGCKAWPALR